MSVSRFFISLTLTLGLLIGSLWWWGATHPMQLFDREYPWWLAKRVMLDRCDLGDLAIVGDSKSFSDLIPDKIGPSVVNLSLGGASLFTISDVAKRIAACPEVPKAVVISLSFKWFSAAECFWDRDVKFGLFDINLEAIRRRSRQENDTSIYDPPVPFDADARLKNFLYKVKFPVYYYSSLLQAAIEDRASTNAIAFDELMKGRGYHALGAVGGNIEPESYNAWTDFVSSPLYDEQFAATLDALNQRHIPVYFISPPYKSTWLQFAHPGFEEHYRAYLDHWAQLYPNLHIVGDIVPSLPPKYFTDQTHLIPRGAAAWSMHVADLLREAHAEGGPFYRPEQ